MTDLFYLVTILPFAGFLINGLFGSRLKNEKLIGSISTLAVLIPFIIGLIQFTELLNLAPESRSILITYYEWIAAGSFSVNVSYLVDPLSITMVLVVTGIGTLIHVYSIGYMHGDKAFAKFFAYLNLFIFAMLNLVLADNLLLIFLGWEGVGLCSYFLIGFWYEQKFTGDAAKKAFIVNRIGDFGFMIAMFFIFSNFNTLEISKFLDSIAGYQIGDTLLLIIALLLLLGAAGKSAQIPLYVWLPDAMAGPTPVSALIHAATMVTAGVYLLARTSLLYAMSPLASQIVFAVGLLTALFASTIALRQYDIKKVLAYSTVSQLGFMFIAIGIGAYWIAIFHLITHAFFKGLLFLGSGSVIHGMHHEQDIRQMGGLKSKMKITYITFLIGSLAIAGIPPLSGFFSKDLIVFDTYIAFGIPFVILALAGAAMTSYYMFRLVSLTFYGKPRYDEKKVHPHESPSTMTIPLIILAVLSIIGGFIGLPGLYGFPNLLKDWLTGFSKVLENKYYVDEAYDKVIVNPIEKTSEKFLWNIFDVKIIDGAVNGIARYVSNISFDWRRIQTGVIQDYAGISVAGIVLILLYLLIV